MDINRYTRQSCDRSCLLHHLGGPYVLGEYWLNGEICGSLMNLWLLDEYFLLRT